MSYGLAVDCGTTHISLLLAEKDAQNAPLFLTLENPCRRFGADVITRADAQAKNPTAKKTLQDEVLRAVRDGANTLAARAGISPNTISRIAFCANPIITHTTLGYDAKELTAFPYPLSETFGKEIPNPLAPYGFSKEATFYVAPLVSAFIGGDVLAGFCDSEKDAPHLYADFGTNGEMILKSEGAVYAASVAAGPALEGGSIRCGMRATPGAIDHVTYANGAFSYTTIANEAPRGLCASGLIEFILSGYEAGLIAKNGLVKDRVLTLTDEISVTTEEVRAVLLAKAAFSAGIRSLLKQAGISDFSTVHLTVAGAFGNGMELSAAARIGLFEPAFLPRAEAKEFAALKGISRALFNKEFPQTLLSAKKTIQVLDLAADAVFQEDYIQSITL